MSRQKLRVLSLSEEQVAQTGRTRIEIPAGTYAGQDAPIVTTSLPVAAFATTKMSDDTAYALIKTFWEQRDAMAGAAAWWAGVDAGLMANVATRFHPGAVRHYREAGVALTDEQQ